MKFKSSWFFICLGLACTRPAKENSDVKLIGGKPAFVIGADSMETKTFTSTAELIFSDASRCTATRVGPRHFLTAAHCIEPGKDIELRSHKTNESFYVGVSPDSLISGSDREVNYDVNRVLFRDGGSDWGLLVATEAGSAYASLNMMKSLDGNFDIRKIGDPAHIKAGDVLLAAGWGIHDRDNSTLLNCPEGDVCNEPSFYETTSAYDRKLRRAFFKITDVAKTSSQDDAFFFEAVAHLDPVPFDYTADGGIKGIDYIAGVLPDDEIGILQGGDSGGPVILEENGEQFIVGVIKGHVAFPTNPEIRENFSSFNKKLVEEKIMQPVVDTLSPYTRPGRSLLVTGYLTEKVEVKALESGIILKADPSCSNLNDSDRSELDGVGEVNRSSYSCWSVPSDLQPQWIEVFSNGVSTGKKVEVLGEGKCSSTALLNSGQTYTNEPEFSFIGPDVWAFLNPEEGTHMERTYQLTPYTEWPRSFDKVTLAIQETGGLECYKYLEDASCVKAPEFYSFEVQANQGTYPIQSPSWQYFTNYQIDITEDFSEWLKSQGEEPSNADFNVSIRALDQNTFEGFRVHLEIHTCDPSREP